MIPGIRIQFAYDDVQRRIVAKDDRENLTPNTSTLLLQWLLALGMQVPGTPEALEVTETIVDQGGIVLPRPLHKITRYLCRRVSMNLNFRDGRMEEFYFLLGHTADMSVQVVGPRLNPENWKAVPWNVRDQEPVPVKPGVGLA
jgi:hypothetical protein